MTRFTKIALAAAALSALSLGAYAGGPECDKAAKANNVAKHEGKCKMSAEDCKRMMAEAKTKGWLGIQGESVESGGWAIQKVFPGSPAEKAGFQVGDVLVAINGIQIKEENNDKLAAAKKSLMPGDTAAYTVVRAGSERKLAAVLGKMPEEVYTAMVADHMKEHVDIASK